MADTSNPDVPNAAASGSVLGKYHTSLQIFEYARENPFTAGPESTKEIANSIIKLPLPIQLYDRTSSAFSQQNMGVIGDLVNEGINSESATAGGLRLLETALPASLSAIGSLGGQFGMRLANSIDTRAITTTIEQAFGYTPNPNPVVKFSGPQLRSFNFSWYLAPKNDKESQNIKNIIDKLKGCSLPAKTNGSVALLKMPKLVQVNFYPWDKKSQGNKWGWNEDSIIKMKRCHISNVSVNYNPANVPAFFKTERPVIIELSIELLEVEYLFEEDWITSWNSTSVINNEKILNTIQNLQSGFNNLSASKVTSLGGAIT